MLGEFKLNVEGLSSVKSIPCDGTVKDCDVCRDIRLRHRQVKKYGLAVVEQADELINKIDSILQRNEPEGWGLRLPSEFQVKVRKAIIEKLLERAV